ncbi:hypothetical protein [Tropicimonas sediminicola]|uniref:A/G-specific DNA-adenine glycosylase n=1 Tax=Tropicimonas sediminicola TaxID=1031541 RepID=A0A239MBT4_9RHOB|nr:hypothetical protein [Tropicimonas sediminicola]SNT40176.1 A/G-specific DNA-adenine glycosylase [Tropicimonas sediminicola]
MSQDRLTRGEKSRITRLRRHLLDWYALEGRDFPWRSDRASAYERICVEVLLQRTRAETVAGIYPSFFGKFPSWTALAAASVEQLEDVIRPIGLWRRRAASIKALATYAAGRDGVFPAGEGELSQVPAVGQYLANAILLFGHGEARPLVDVNMARLLERYLRPRRLADIRHDPWLQEACHWLVVCDDPVRVNWAALDYAAKVCRSRYPGCADCKLRVRCNWGRGGGGWSIA